MLFDCNKTLSCLLCTCALALAGCGDDASTETGSDGADEAATTDTADTGTAGDEVGTDGTTTGDGDTTTGDTTTGDTTTGDTTTDTGGMTTDTTTGVDTGTDTGGTDTGEAMCPAEDGDTECDTCTKSNCCPEIQACEADEDCACIAACVAEGGDLIPCAGDCNVMGVSVAFQTLSACTLENCTMECSG